MDQTLDLKADAKTQAERQSLRGYVNGLDLI